MQNSRLKLYRKFRDVSDTGFDKKYKNFSEWEKINFSNETSVQDIWNKALRAYDIDDNILWGSDLETFYKTFACDLEWAKKTNYCPKPPAPTPTPPPPPPPYDPRQDMDTSARRVVPPIKEQVLNGKIENPQLKQGIQRAQQLLSNPESNTEQTKIDLKLAVQNDCFSKFGVVVDENFEVPTRIKNLRGVLVNAVITNKKSGGYIYFFEDGTALDITTDGKKEEKTWDCSSLKQTTSFTANPKNLTPDQQEFVNTMVEIGNFQLEKPNDYELSQGMWEPVDLYNLEKSTLRDTKIFPRPKEYFGYIQKGVLGKLQNQYGTILNNLKANSYTLDEPLIDTPAYSSGKLIKKVFPKYAKYFGDKQMVYYTGGNLSGDLIKKARPIITQIKTAFASPDTSVDDNLCKSAINLLYDAKQVWDRNLRYFENESEIDVVRNYAKRCKVKKGLLGNKTDLYNAWKDLTTTKFNERGKSRFNLVVDEHNLSKIIKKKLMEMKKIKSALIS